MKKSSKHTLLLVVAAALVAVFSASCGTVNGFGKDVDTAGDKIQHASR